MKLFSNTIQTLEQALNYSTTKQKVIAENISNADTPGYKRKTVSFQTELDSAINSAATTTNRTNVKHFNFSSTNGSGFQVQTDRSTAYNNTGNNVDVDKEMADLATNQIYYNALVERISGKFNSLQTVIKGGR